LEKKEDKCGEEGEIIRSIQELLFHKLSERNLIINLGNDINGYTK
jgi:hypothetical protein